MFRRPVEDEARQTGDTAERWAQLVVWVQHFIVRFNYGFDSCIGIKNLNDENKRKFKIKL